MFKITMKICCGEAFMLDAFSVAEIAEPEHYKVYSVSQKIYHPPPNMF